MEYIIGAFVKLLYSQSTKKINYNKKYQYIINILNKKFHKLKKFNKKDKKKRINRKD